MPRIRRLQDDEEEEEEYFPLWKQTGSEHSRSTEEENNGSSESNTGPNQGTQVRVDENGRIILEIEGGRLMQPFSSEMDHDESGLQVQQNSPPNNLTTVFSGPYSLGRITSSTNNGTILGSHFTNGWDQLEISLVLVNLVTLGAA
ncbi:unnamed protein product [Fraxinus pennsylvanica]|uniref:Uncharacterized protein n=1 Tax=Fraxinus pennsylvanica TaxID=56036 RepID=A0AAD1Z9G6_9LAMI|nr:unnamed protein product [Fraxinus pennsylvanica]